MGMVVRSNIMALNANRQLGMNNTQVSKSLEKLSSGFKINRAGDDASGLAISEKMKAQIKGLETASANSQDGISLVQTAEGALTEVHSMLNRMVELATKSANGTLQDDVDRDAIQSEIDALTSEIDRIGDSTNFNGINLLDGSLSAGKVDSVNGATATADVNASFTIDLAGLAGDGTDPSTFTLTISGETVSGDAVATSANASAIATSFNGKTITIGGQTFTAANDGTKLVFTADAAGALDGTEDFATAVTAADGGGKSGGDGSEALTSGAITDVVAGAEVGDETAGVTTIDFTKITAGTTLKIGDTTYEFVEAGKAAATGNTAITLGANLTDTLTNLNTELTNNPLANIDASINGNTLTLTNTASTGSSAAPEVALKGTGLTLQIGDSSADFNKMSVSVADMRSAGLGISGLDVSTADAAADAIQTIKDAINTVSTNRANMGALQNRLEYTINNLDVSSENLNSANSRIRDTDMAKEMMNYTKMNVLTQAAQAMLAQANQQPQSILQLLQ